MSFDSPLTDVSERSLDGAQVSPDTGTTTSYIYDAAGNRTSRTDARGVTVHYRYDALNRLTAIDCGDDGQDVAFTYDTCTQGWVGSVRCRTDRGPPPTPTMRGET